MKTLIAAALVSVLAAGAALPAFAQDYRGDARGYGPQEWRGDEIVVRTRDGEFAIPPRDQLFSRLTERPYGFRPGFTYFYTGRCGSDGCLVIETRAGRVTNRFVAPDLSFDMASLSEDDERGEDANAPDEAQPYRGPQSAHDMQRRDDDARDQNDEPDVGKPEAQDEPSQDDQAPYDDEPPPTDDSEGRDGQLLGGPH